MIKVCIDSNVWLSGINFGGIPGEIVQLGLKKKFQIVISDFILKEIDRNLTHKFDISKRKKMRLLYRIAQISDVYEPRGSVTIIPNRHPDNLVLETAWIGRAKYLVTGDKEHLLPLKTFRNIKIIEPSNFLSIIKK